MRLVLLGTLLAPLMLWAQEVPVETQNVKFDHELKRARDYFSQGKYGATRSSLNALAGTLRTGRGNKTLIGLVSYWTGITANRQQEYAEAIEAFEQSLAVDYRPKDIYYEYGQALFAADKLREAQSAFRESVKRGHKRAVSLYYLGFISQTLGDNKRAVTFYRAIQRLPKQEQDDTVQAAEMQVGDIYLTQAEKHPDAFRAVDTYVIPQYERAIEMDPDSKLAGEMRTKIIGLQQKYELVLFQMRNGRRTSVPPYFLRLSQDLTMDSNPVFAADETTNTESKQSSLVSKTEAQGRYTFYHKNIMSFSPELRMNYLRHLKREPEIYRNDSWALLPSLRTSYEHSIGKKPASFLADFDYVYTHRDVNGEEDLVFNSRAQTLMIGERIQGLLSSGDTTFRLRVRNFESYNPDSDSKGLGVGFDQIVPTKSGNLFIFVVNYDQTRVESDVFDSNTLFLRADVILPVWKKWQITPQFGFGLTLNDPMNDESRGTETTLNPSMRLSKQFWKRYRVSFHADHIRNDSDNKESFAYQKTFYGFELEYIF
jgi:tetratricopeptide (TPR) repeat protein